jgi:hypothetical protein
MLFCVRDNNAFLFQILQTLGMPLSLASLISLYAEPVAICLIYAVGWLSDRGTNPHRRKAFAVVFGCVALLCGVSCLFVADLLHLRDLDEYLQSCLLNETQDDDCYEKNSSADVAQNWTQGQGPKDVTWNQHTPSNENATRTVILHFFPVGMGVCGVGC